MNASTEELVKNIFSDDTWIIDDTPYVGLIVALIQQEQLKLLERIEGEVIGEDVCSYSKPLEMPDSHYEKLRAILSKQQEQRQALAKLKAEIEGK